MGKHNTLARIYSIKSIKFTHEIEEEKKMPFLDALVVWRDDGS